MKKIYMALFLLLFFIANCNKKHPDLGNNFLLEYRYEIEFKNEYNNRGLLVKTISFGTYFYPSGKIEDHSEYFYFYDQRDSLIREESFALDLNNNNKKLISIKLFSDSTSKDVFFREYPKDTITYIFEKKDKNGNPLEYYREEKMINPEGNLEITKNKKSYKYNSLDNTISILDKDLINNIVSTYSRKIKTNSINDTIIVDTFDEQNKLLSKVKKYNADKYKVEVEEMFYDYYSIDSIFYIGKKIRQISINEFGKRIDEKEHDEKGNPIRLESEVYRVKEERLKNVK